MIIKLTEADGGVLLPLHVVTRAGKNETRGAHAGALKVYVTAPPDKGRANKAVIKLLAKTFKTARSGITLKSGEKSRTKVVHIAGISEKGIYQCLK